MKIVKTTTDKIGEITGSAARGLASGVYKGVTGKTNEQIAEDRNKREKDLLIFRKSLDVRMWAFRIAYCMCISVFIYCAYKGNFKDVTFLEWIGDKKVIFGTIIGLSLMVSAFSKTIAKAIVR